MNLKNKNQLIKILKIFRRALNSGRVVASFRSKRQFQPSWTDKRGKRLERGLWRVLAFCLALHCCLVFNLWQINAEESGLIQVDSRHGNSGLSVRRDGGTDIVDIVGADSRGVSHNRFAKFSVDVGGVVLNNNSTGRSSRSSLLKKSVAANENLRGTGSAKLILNEVTSIDGSNISQLKGTTEILGKKADYVLANPNGVVCDGCGFTGTKRVTLSTARHFESGQQGEWGLETSSNGIVEIKNGGLNAENVSYFDIISRQAKIGGKVKAKKFRMELGAGSFMYNRKNKGLKRSASVGGGDPIQGEALDVAAVGGIEADRITLNSTDQGVGVKIAGDMTASAGNLTLTADGKIKIAGSNTKVSANRGRVVVSSVSDEIDLEGKLEALGTENSVILNALTNIKLASSSRVEGSKFVQLNLTGSADGQGKVSNEGDIFANMVFLNVGGEVGDGSGYSNIASLENKGNITASRWLEVRATGDLDNTGLLDGGTGYIYLDTKFGQLTNTGSGSVKGISGVRVLSGKFTNQAKVFGGLSLVVSSQVGVAREEINGNIESSGGSLLSLGNLVLHAAGGLTGGVGSINISGTSVGAGKELHFVAEHGRISVGSSTIVAGEGAYLKAKGGDLTEAGDLVLADNDVPTEASDATTSALVINNGSTIRSSKIRLEATNGSVTNAGAYIVARKTRMTDDMLENIEGVGARSDNVNFLLRAGNLGSLDDLTASDDLASGTSFQALLKKVNLGDEELEGLKSVVERATSGALTGGELDAFVEGLQSLLAESEGVDEVAEKSILGLEVDAIVAELTSSVDRAEFSSQQTGEGTLTIISGDGQDIINQGAGRLIADSLNISVGDGMGSFKNLDASKVISLEGDLTITAKRFVNAGLISVNKSKKTLKLRAGAHRRADLIQGTIEGGGSGQLYSEGNIHLDLGDGALFNQASSNIVSKGRVIIDAGSLYNMASAKIRAEGDGEQQAIDITLTGSTPWYLDRSTQEGYSPEFLKRITGGVSDSDEDESSEPGKLALLNRGDIHSTKGISINLAGNVRLKDDGRRIVNTGNITAVGSLEIDGGNNIDFENTGEVKVAAASAEDKLGGDITIRLGSGQFTNKGELTNLIKVTGGDTEEKVERINPDDDEWREKIDKSASQGSITINAASLKNVDGKIISLGTATLKATGTDSGDCGNDAAGDATLPAGCIKNEGNGSTIETIKGKLTLRGHQLLNLTGATIHGGRVNGDEVNGDEVESDTNLIFNGAIYNGEEAEDEDSKAGGKITSAGSMYIKAASLYNKGTIESGVDYAEFKKDAGAWSRRDNIENEINSKLTLDINGNIKNAVNAFIKSTGTLSITADTTADNTLENEGSILARGVDAAAGAESTLEFKGDVTNKGTIAIGGTDAKLSGANLTNLGGIHLCEQLGEGEAAGCNYAGRTENSPTPNSTLTLNFTGNVNNSKSEEGSPSTGDIRSDAHLVLKGDELTNEGTIRSGFSMNISGKKLTNHNMIQVDDENVMSRGGSSLTLVFSEAVENIKIYDTSTATSKPTIESSGHLTIASKGLIENKGAIESGRTVLLSGTTLANYGTIESGKALDVIMREDGIRFLRYKSDASLTYSINALETARAWNEKYGGGAEHIIQEQEAKIGAHVEEGAHS